CRRATGETRMDLSHRPIVKNALRCIYSSYKQMSKISHAISEMDVWKNLIPLFAVLLLVSANARAEKAHNIEIRFCPGTAVRSYPLNSQRELQSVLLHNVAIINHDTAIFKIE